jgi:hypothetical protein
VTCDAQIPRANLRASHGKFYSDGVNAPASGPATVSCSWKIPASAHGKLSVQAAASTTQGTLGSLVLSWRIKR